MKLFPRLFVVFVAMAWPVASSVSAEFRVQLKLDKPAAVNPQSWPVSVGVPFKAGAVKDVANLCVVDAAGAVQPCQVARTGSWDDGSVRWALVDFQPALTERYFLVEGRPQPQLDDIQITRDGDSVRVSTMRAVYEFHKGDGCFRSVSLINRPDKLIDGAQDAFYAVDSQGRRGVFKGKALDIELEGPRHTVVRVEGEYLTPDGPRNAAGVVYYHFYAGRPEVKISHKIIVTEETLDLWFRDIGIALPLALKGDIRASFNDDHDQPAHTWAAPLAADETLVMVQETFPHFAKTDSKFTIRSDRNGATAERATGAACGEWADVSSADAGVAVQLPAFAEQFPKAFRASAKQLVVKLWAGEETGQELDWRTEQIVKNYFGHDWIPADNAVATAPNSARSTAKTHEVWLYPHEGALSEPIVRNFAATRDEIFATPDPAHVASTGAMDPFLPAAPDRFPDVEAAIEDYFLKNVTVPERIFPNTGYIAWGRNPYVTAMWEKKNGRWYPAVHRLSRNLEYNLKRAVWVIYARSGDRRYRDYARRYTRFLGDWYISNFDTAHKPIGWLAQGEPWNSPCFWGAAPEKVIREGKGDAFINEYFTLGYGTSEDIIQFVYDYFVANDYHSRDAAVNYKNAFLKELGGNVDKAMTAVPTYVILRPMASAYEIDHDPRLYDLGHKILQRVVGDGSDVVNMSVPQNYLKSGEIWAGFYHYYVSTGDELAYQVLLRAAERYYRTDRVELIYRGSGMPQAFMYAFEKTRDPAYIAYLRQAIHDFAHKGGSLKERGIDVEKVTQSFDQPWGHGGAITEASPIMIGIPVALRALAQHKEPTPSVPLAQKPAPTHRTHVLVKKDAPGSATIDLYINNDSHRTLEPKITDLAGQPVPCEVVVREAHRVPDPSGDAAWQHFFNSFYNTYGTHAFYRLKLDAPPGVYRIDCGNEVTVTVLYSDLAKIVQVAPDGLVLAGNRTHYFSVPPGTATVEFFAHRPVRIVDPSDKEVTLESLDEGNYRFATGGNAGTWKILPRGDELSKPNPFLNVDSFVRMINMPMVVALDDPNRMFEADVSALTSSKPADLPTADAMKQPFAEGRIGQAAVLKRGQAVEVQPLPEKVPFEKGTVEFWFRPMWSVDQLHLAKTAGNATVRQELYSFDPLLIALNVDPLDSGRSAGYLKSRLEVVVQTPKGPWIYPVSFYPQAGEWYHLAVTWNVDGATSDVSVFVNGHQKTYAHYQGGIPATLKPDDLVPQGQSIRFGNGIYYGKFEPSEQLLDEFRLSDVVRYTESFEPPTREFVFDGNTRLLLHFDGSARMEGSGLMAEVKEIGRLKPGK